MSIVLWETPGAFYHAWTFVMFGSLATSFATTSIALTSLDKGKGISTNSVVSSARFLQTSISCGGKPLSFWEPSKCDTIAEEDSNEDVPLVPLPVLAITRASSSTSVPPPLPPYVDAIHDDTERDDGFPFPIWTSVFCQRIPSLVPIPYMGIWFSTLDLHLCASDWLGCIYQMFLLILLLLEDAHPLWGYRPCN